jgi:hypothetical protein
MAQRRDEPGLRQGGAQQLVLRTASRTAGGGRNPASNADASTSRSRCARLTSRSSRPTAQAGDEILVDAHLCWLARAEDSLTLAMTARALATALATHGQWLCLPALGRAGAWVR